MKMRFEQLRYFVAVAETRHFTHAADAVGVTQPSLSKQIQALEHELGTPLFTRIRGNVALTPAGEALLPRARGLLADLDTAKLEVQALIGLRQGRVRLGATPSLCTSLVAPVLRVFTDLYPGVRPQIREGGSQDLVAALVRGELDLALIVLPSGGVDAALDTRAILKEPLVAASSPALPAPTDRPALDLADLRDQPLVMFRVGYDLRDATLEACRRAGFTPGFAVEGGEMDAVLSFVEAGLGVALVPSLVLAGRPGLRVTPLAPPGIHRTIALAHRRDVPLTTAAQALRGVLTRWLDEAVVWQRLPSGVTVL